MIEEEEEQQEEEDCETKIYISTKCTRNLARKIHTMNNEQSTVNSQQSTSISYLKPFTLRRLLGGAVHFIRSCHGVDRRGYVRNGPLIIRIVPLVCYTGLVCSVSYRR
jgi:hypothetical protein